MHWNHRGVHRQQVELRVVKRVYPEHDYVEYGIHEVYYDDQSDEHPGGSTMEPIGAVGESVEDLRETLTRMLAACDRDVLDYDAIGSDAI